MPLSELGLWLGITVASGVLYVSAARIHHDRVRANLRLIAYLLAVVGVKELSYASYFGPVGEDPGVFWLSSGLHLAVLLSVSWRRYPLYVAMTALTHLTTGHLLHDLPWQTNLWWSFATVFEAVIGSLLLRWTIKGKPDITHPRTFVLYLVLCGGVATAVCAAIGSSVLALIYGQTDWLVNWQVWWLSDLMGVLSLGTALLAWNSSANFAPARRTMPRLVEGTSFCVLLVLATGVAVGPFAIATQSVLDYPYLVLPLLFWAALRFDARQATAAALFVAVATVYTANGTVARIPGISDTDRGPFSQPANSVADTVLAIQTFMFVALFTTQMIVSMTYQRKRYEYQRLEIQDQLYQSQRMESVAQLASGIAHDLNNLLAVIALYRDEVEHRVGDDPALSPALSAMDDATENAAAVSRALLNLSRHDHASDGPVDLGELLRRAMRVCQPLLPKSIRVTCTAPSDTPIVIGDHNLLQQVLLNLVLNARDALAPRGGEIHAWVDITPDQPPLAVIGVRDNGQGICPEDLPYIFEPLFTTKPHGAGTGLGLSIVRSIIKEHGGSVQVESDPGRGTTFRVMLPLVSQAGPAQLKRDAAAQTGVYAAVASNGRPQATPTDRDPRTALLLMHDPQVLGAMRAELTSQGWKVLTFTRFEDYDQAVIHAKPDTVGLIDLRASDDPDALARTLQPIPTLLLSVHGTPPNFEDPQARILTMPFHLREVATILRGMG